MLFCDHQHIFRDIIYVPQLGNGSSSRNFTFEEIAKQSTTTDAASPLSLNPYSALCVTVPGAAALWEDLVVRYGSHKLTLMDVLAPAVDLAQSKYVVLTFANK